MVTLSSWYWQPRIEQRRGGDTFSEMRSKILRAEEEEDGPERVLLEPDP